LPVETLAGVLLASAILFLGLWPSPFVDRIAQGLKDIPAVCPNQKCDVPFGGSGRNPGNGPGQRPSVWTPELAPRGLRSAGVAVLQ